MCHKLDESQEKWWMEKANSEKNAQHGCMYPLYSYRTQTVIGILYPHRYRIPSYLYRWISHIHKIKNQRDSKCNIEKGGPSDGWGRPWGQQDRKVYGVCCFFFLCTLTKNNFKKSDNAWHPSSPLGFVNRSVERAGWWLEKDGLRQWFA